MGIGNDIKPKQTKPDEVPEVVETALKEEPTPQVSGEEIPINTSKPANPVYEDLLPRTEKPFDHLEGNEPNAEFIKPDSIKEIIHHEQEENKVEDEDEIEQKPINREDSFKSFAEYHEKQPRPKSHLLTIIIILFVLLLATLLILQNLDRIKEIVGIKPEVANTDKPITSGVEIIGNEDISTSNTTAQVPANNSTANTTAPTTGAPGNTAAPSTGTPAATANTTNVSALKVKVLNGNGIAGSAASVKNKLVAAGYTIGTVTNAARFTYTNTIVYYNTGKQSEASALAALLSDRQTEVVLNASVAGTFDIVVVVGKN